MSLNGLENLEVKEAHEKATAEPGGWFLLQYACRDEVKLFARGNCGITEMRDAIANFEKSSPLFGFIQYRRKNVLIKYVPDDCTRLDKARCIVHFNAITEYFSQHDVTFSMTCLHELRDTVLSAACSYHTTSNSTSSSTSSLHRQRLVEIAEEEEETREKRKSVASEISEGEFCVAKVVSISESSVSPPSKDRTSSFGPQSWDLDTPRLSISLLGTDLQPNMSSYSNSSECTERLSDHYSYPPSTSSSRNKVRLGPRPSQDVGWRPHSSTSSPYRPISALPAGLKSFAKWNKFEKEESRPSCDSDNRSPVMNSPPSSPSSSMLTADVAIRPSSSNDRPTSSSDVSSGSISSTSISETPKVHTIDTARARLFKAQEMWKKKMEASEALHSNSIKVDTLLPDICCDVVLF